MKIEKVSKLDLWDNIHSPSGGHENKINNLELQVKNKGIINLDITTISTTLNKDIKGNSDMLLNKCNMYTNRIHESFFRSEFMEDIHYDNENKSVYERAIREIIVFTILNELADIINNELLIYIDTTCTPQWCSQNYIINSIVNEVRKLNILSYKITSNDKSFVYINNSKSLITNSYKDKIKNNVVHLFKSVHKHINLEEYPIININLAEVVGNINQILFLSKLEPLNKEYKEICELTGICTRLKRKIFDINTNLADVPVSNLQSFAQQSFALYYASIDNDSYDKYIELKNENPTYYIDKDEFRTAYKLLSNSNLSTNDKIKLADELTVLNNKTIRNFRFKTLG